MYSVLVFFATLLAISISSDATEICSESQVKLQKEVYESVKPLRSKCINELSTSSINYGCPKECEDWSRTTEKKMKEHGVYDCRPPTENGLSPRVKLYSSMYECRRVDRCPGSDMDTNGKYSEALKASKEKCSKAQNLQDKDSCISECNPYFKNYARIQKDIPNCYDMSRLNPHVPFKALENSCGNPKACSIEEFEAFQKVLQAIQSREDKCISDLAESSSSSCPGSCSKYFNLFEELMDQFPACEISPGVTAQKLLEQKKRICDADTECKISTINLNPGGSFHSSGISFKRVNEYFPNPAILFEDMQYAQDICSQDDGHQVHMNGMVGSMFWDDSMKVRNCFFKCPGKDTKYRVIDRNFPEQDENSCSSCYLDLLFLRTRKIKLDGNASTTEPTITEEPSTQKPSTKAPATDSPTTKEPSTQKPSTKTPATDSPNTPSTKAPVSDPSATPATKAPVPESHVTPATKTPSGDTSNKDKDTKDNNPDNSNAATTISVLAMAVVGIVASFVQ